MSTAVKRKIFDNRFEIISIIGRGANSVIYLAKSTTAPYKDIALKVLTNSKTEINSAERLRTEAIAMVAARHKYVMPLDDFNSVGDISYLSMDYAPGLDLRNFIRTNGNLSTAQIIRFFKQITEALAHLHSEGIIHHDLKPDNILVINERLVKLTDFGLATLPGQSTQINELQKGVGTLDYMAPEILEGINSGTASDVYALCLSFYELLSGRNPFADIPLSKVLDVRKAGLEDIKNLVPELEQNYAKAIMDGLIYEESARLQDGGSVLSVINNTNFAVQPIEPEPISLIPSSNEAVSESSWDDFLGSLEEPKEEVVENAKVEPVSEEVETKSDTSWDDFLSSLEKTEEPEVSAKAEEPATDFSNDLEPKENVNMDDNNQATEAKSKSEESWDDFLKSLDADEPTKEPVSQSEDDKAWEDFLKSLESDLNENKQENETPKQPEISFSELNTKVPAERLPQDFSHERHHEINEVELDPFTPVKDEESEEVEHHSRIPMSFETNEKKSFPIFKVIALCLVGFIIFKIFFGGSSSSTSSTSSESHESTERIKISNNFPFLEPGIYSGNMYGLIPGTKNNLTFISTPDKKLVVVTNIPGWQPTVIDLNNSKIHEGKLTVTSNGYIFKLSADEEKDSLKGRFKDESTKSRGEWEITSLSN